MKHRTLAAIAVVPVAIGVIGLSFSSQVRRHIGKPAAASDAVAFQRLQVRASQGDAGAENDVGASYESGTGVARDLAQAAHWYQAAADQGFGTAQTNIGRLYAMGQGVRQDYGVAMAWFQKAAKQGDGVAMTDIGRLYGEGDGVPQDKVEALKWLDLAEARFSAGRIEEPGWAKENRTGLAATMTPAQVAEAQRRAATVSHDGGRPVWVDPGQVALLSKIGIDPVNDVEEKGNYHWSWRARAALSVSSYSCPAGSEVVISRTIMLVRAPQNAACQTARGARVAMLKFLPGGLAEPLSD